MKPSAREAWCGVERSGFTCDRERGHGGAHRGYDSVIDEPVFWLAESTAPDEHELVVHDDGSLTAERDYVSWSPSDRTAILDGEFTVEQLEAIAQHMRRRSRLSPKGGSA